MARRWAPNPKIETTRRERDHSDEGVFHKHFPQLLVGPLALEDDALRDDDPGAAGGREVLGHVIHKQDFTALGLDGETLVRLDPALGVEVLFLQRDAGFELDVRGAIGIREESPACVFEQLVDLDAGGGLFHWAWGVGVPGRQATLPGRGGGVAGTARLSPGLFGRGSTPAAGGVAVAVAGLDPRTHAHSGLACVPSQSKSGRAVVS